MTCRYLRFMVCLWPTVSQYFFYITLCWKCEYQWTAIEVKTFTLPQGRDDRLEVAEVKVCRWNEETSFIGTHAHHAKKKQRILSETSPGHSTYSLIRQLPLGHQERTRPAVQSVKIYWKIQWLVSVHSVSVRRVFSVWSRTVQRDPTAVLSAERCSLRSLFHAHPSELMICWREWKKWSYLLQTILRIQPMLDLETYSVMNALEENTKPWSLV